MNSAAPIVFIRRLFHLRRGGVSFENPRYLLKWLFISTATRGSTVIEPGDQIAFLVSPGGEESLQTYLAERVVHTERTEPILLE
jgi:hypothetical protein